MFHLFTKEIASFFSSVMGYLIVFIFLILNGLFLFIFKGDTNIFNLEYASLNSFFFISPWILIFIIPAVTMKTIAEERKLGTLELLLTKPISEFQIVFSKFLASWILMCLAFVPTLIYVFTIYQLGLPIGNLDVGEIIGGYLGLLMLSAVFCAIGICTSTFTDNQVVAFMLGVFVCFFMFYGFSAMADYQMFGSWDSIFVNLGLNEHYINMGIGVIDSRDVLYFLSVIFFCLVLSHHKLKSIKC